MCLTNADLYVHMYTRRESMTVYGIVLEYQSDGSIRDKWKHLERLVVQADRRRKRTVSVVADRTNYTVAAMGELSIDSMIRTERFAT